jgi:hypothetical protein
VTGRRICCSAEPIAVPEREYAYARLSPDGSRVALDVRDQDSDIWIWDLARRTLQRLTFDPGPNRGLAWSPDGARGGSERYWTAAAEADFGVQLTAARGDDGRRRGRSLTRGRTASMEASAPSRILSSGVLGVFVFCAVQVPLLLATRAVPGGMNAPGWFLNSGRNVLLVAAILAAGAAILSVRRRASVPDVVSYGIGAVAAMSVTLFAIGPGTIFPIVIAFGSCVVALAVLAGASCGAAVRALWVRVAA